MVFYFVGHIFAIANDVLVYGRNARNPVAVKNFSIPLNIVLTSGKIPHEIAHVHMPYLVAYHKTDILRKAGFTFGAVTIVHRVTISVSHNIPFAVAAGIEHIFSLILAQLRYSLICESSALYIRGKMVEKPLSYL